MQKSVICLIAILACLSFAAAATSFAGSDSSTGSGSVTEEGTKGCPGCGPGQGSLFLAAPAGHRYRYQPDSAAIGFGQLALEKGTNDGVIHLQDIIEADNFFRKPVPGNRPVRRSACPHIETRCVLYARRAWFYVPP